MNVIDQLRSRMKSNWPSRSKSAVEAIFKSAQSFQSEVSVINADQELSGQGKAKRIREAASKSAGPAYAKAMRFVERERARIKSERAGLMQKLAGADDKFGPEIRSLVRNMSQGEASAVLMGPDADPCVVAAVFAAPAFLSKVSPQLREVIVKDYLDRHHSKEIATIREAEEALEMVLSATKLLRNDLVKVAEVAEPSFDKWIADNFVPTPEMLRAEGDEVHASDQRDLLEAARRIPLSERIKFGAAILDMNTAELTDA